MKKTRWTKMLENFVEAAGIERIAAETDVTAFEIGSSALEEAAKLYGDATDRYRAIEKILEGMKPVGAGEKIRNETLAFVRFRIDHTTRKQAYWADQAEKLRRHE